MADMLPMSGGIEPVPDWSKDTPTEGPKSRAVWNDRDIAGWLKHNSPSSLTLSEAWRMAHALSKGPLADVWLDGARRGCTFNCERVE